MMIYRRWRWALVMMLILSAFPSAQAEVSTARDAEWAQLRQQAINRPRRFLFNNDGNEPVKFCWTATKEELLRGRTTPLAGTQVDAIFYCTWASGFGLFTHFTKVGQVLMTREGPLANNRIPDFVREGIDPLQVMVEAAHQQNQELFWSLRMNDKHDANSEPFGAALFRTNRLKQAHPEWLMGTRTRRPARGAWSAVQFDVPEIRDLVFRYCEEVCQNYDVDGIELDFFRHALFFKCSSQGKPCGEVELTQMTELVRRIRAMTEELGRNRNRPILLAIRVPDSVEYCKYLGLDLERWLKEGLLDLLVVGGYTQLNPWEYSVQLGHKYGVKVYPSLDEPRVPDAHARALRFSRATYRGRALNVWNAGADGVYLFNFFDFHSPLLRELGDPKTLPTQERNYFASVRGAGDMLVPHQQFLRVPVLNPASPLRVTAKTPTRIEFRVGEDLSQVSPPPQVVLRLQLARGGPANKLIATLNGARLGNPKVEEQWLTYQLTGKELREGSNTLELRCTDTRTSALTLSDLYVNVRSQ